MSVSSGDVTGSTEVWLQHLREGTGLARSRHILTYDLSDYSMDGSVLLGCSSLLSTGPSYSLERELETHVTIRRSRDLPSSSGLSSLRTQDTDTWRTRLSRIMTPPPSQAASSADINTCSDHVEDTCHHPADRCLLTLERRMTGLARQIRKFDLTPPKLMSPFCKNERSFKQKH